MNELNTGFAVRLECSDGPLTPCRIFLPHQSPLGILDHRQSPPTGEWTAVFLCLQHGQVSVRSSQDVSQDVHMQGQPQSIPFWQLQCEGAHENCGERHTIYTAGLPDLQKIATLLLRINPIVPCG